MAYAILLILAAAAGDPPATPSPAGKRAARDPNAMVCKREEVTGSRLQSRRVCRTRAEWEEQRQIDRFNVERSQVGACQQQGGC